MSDSIEVTETDVYNFVTDEVAKGKDSAFPFFLQEGEKYTKRKMVKMEELVTNVNTFIKTPGLPPSVALDFSLKVLRLGTYDFSSNKAGVGFENKYNNYLKFINENNRRPKVYSDNKYESSLSRWYYKQKAKLNHGTMKEEYIRRFESLMTQTNKFSDTYRNNYKFPIDKYKSYLGIIKKHQETNTSVPAINSDGSRNKVFTWFDNKIGDYRSGKLRKEYSDLFNNYGIDISKISEQKRKQPKGRKLSESEKFDRLNYLLNYVKLGTPAYKSKYKYYYYSLLKNYEKQSKKNKQLIDEIKLINNQLVKKDPKEILNNILEHVKGGQSVASHKNKSMYYSRKRLLDEQPSEIKIIIEEIELFNNQLVKKDPKEILNNILEHVKGGQSVASHKNKSMYYSRKRLLDEQPSEIKLTIKEISFYKSM